MLLLSFMDAQVIGTWSEVQAVTQGPWGSLQLVERGGLNAGTLMCRADDAHQVEAWADEAGLELLARSPDGQPRAGRLLKRR